MTVFEKTNAIHHLNKAYEGDFYSVKNLDGSRNLYSLNRTNRSVPPVSRQEKLLFFSRFMRNEAFARFYSQNDCSMVDIVITLENLYNEGINGFAWASYMMHEYLGIKEDIQFGYENTIRYGEGGQYLVIYDIAPREPESCLDWEWMHYVPQDWAERHSWSECEYVKYHGMPEENVDSSLCANVLNKYEIYA